MARGYSFEAAKDAAEELVFDEDADANALQAAFAKAMRLNASRPPEQKKSASGCTACGRASNRPILMSFWRVKIYDQ